ncbi:MAG: aminotransferase class I/II-fold pyridoxal phosphate-dependent enzyme [Longimicrobiaceae bacterium]
MPTFSRRLDLLPPYLQGEIPRIKRELRARGIDVIDLGAGDADLAPPPAAVEVLREAVQDPVNSRYAFQQGLPAFREEIARFMERRFGVTVDPHRELALLVGSKDGIFHLPITLLDPGDVAIIPDPGYQPYLGGTVLAGGTPYLVPLRAENDFLVPVEQIPADVARAAKLLYLNYPNNPTTSIASREYLERVVDFCRRNDIVLAFDNAYSELGFDGYKAPSILEIPGARDVAVEFFSMSKTYNMTGWRIGWVAGNADIISALVQVKGLSDTGAPLFVQHAAAAALASHDQWFPGNRDTFRRRRDAAVAQLQEGGWEIEAPESTMYLWIPLPDDQPSQPFAQRLLQEEGVAVLPGSALGAAGEGFFRIALTASEERLREAARRIGSAP